ncbi:MAG TPA: MFS transporter [Streptosporangiaceae bacterium]
MTNTQLSEAEARQAQPARPRSPLPVLMTAVFAIVLDFFVVNVALPDVQADLHTGSAATEWIVAGYGLAFAVLIITGGRLGDRFGRRRLFCAGLALFVLTSALCGLATSPAMLVGARFAQGAGAALISPNVLAIIGIHFAGPARVRAITIYGIVMGLAAAGGQLLGGLIIAANPLGLGWRAIFLINIPIGLGALAWSRRQIAESRAPLSSRLDTRGVVLVTLGLTALVLPLVEGTALHWPAWTWASLAAAPIILGAFVASQVRVERRGGTPLLPPSLFRRPELAAGLVTQLVFWCGMASLFLVLALYLQLGHGLDALQAGLVFTVLAAFYLVTSLRAPVLTLRFGRRLIAVGALVLAIGEVALLLAVAERGGGSVAWLVPGLALAGAGMGLCITPLTSTVLAHADPQRAGAVTGALSTMQQVGNAVGVAITGVIFFRLLSSGYGRAFEVSLAELAGLLLAVAVLAIVLPGRSRRPALSGRPAPEVAGGGRSDA